VSVKPETELKSGCIQKRETDVNNTGSHGCRLECIALTEPCETSGVVSLSFLFLCVLAERLLSQIPED